MTNDKKMFTQNHS